MLNTDFAALLKAKDEIRRTSIRTIVINGLERLLFTKKAMKASEINTGMKQLNALAEETKCAILLGSEDIHPDGSVISRNQVEPIKRIPRSILRIERRDSTFIATQEKNNIAEIRVRIAFSSWLQSSRRSCISVPTGELECFRLSVRRSSADTSRALAIRIRRSRLVDCNI